MPTQEKRTLLMHAAEHGHINAIKLLIHEKATVDHTDKVALN